MKSSPPKGVVYARQTAQFKLTIIRALPLLSLPDRGKLTRRFSNATLGKARIFQIGASK